MSIGDTAGLLTAGVVALILIGLLGPRLLPNHLEPPDDEGTTP